MSRNRILSAMLIVGIAASAGAQQYVGCPDTSPSTGNGGNTFPMGNNPEWRYQQYLPASCLPSGPFKIVDMAYSAQAASSHPGVYQDFQVRMALTTLTTLTTSFATNLGQNSVLVMNRPTFNWAYQTNTWVDFGLDCPFAYDGQSNIVIEVRYRGAAGTNLFCWRVAYPRAYTSGAGAYTATTATRLLPGDALKVRFTVDANCVVSATPQVQIGSSGSLALLQAGAGVQYVMATAFGYSTMIPWGSDTVCLDPDPLFTLSVTGSPLFSGYVGTTAASGGATGTFLVPNLPPLVGLSLAHAAVTVSPMRGSNTALTRIIP